MLKYDSYGWIERPTEREFETMLDRQKEHSWKTGGGAAAAEEEADAVADAGGESSATAAIVANPVYNVDYTDNNGDLSIWKFVPDAILKVRREGAWVRTPV